MPRNGNGTYSLPANSWFPAINGAAATSDDWNITAQDIQSALTQSISNDGQTPMQNNLPMGNNKITGLANGSATTDAAAFGQVARYVGNCRLIKSGANLLLIPFNGNQLTINGALQTVPSAGVTLTPTGSAGTTYYIYAFMNAGTMTLEASTTTHATDTTTGAEIKTGDASRTLVGMARPITGPAWQDAINQRFVVSWFNRRPIQTQAGLGSDSVTNSSAFVEVNTGLRNEFLTWGTNSASFSFDGRVSQSIGGSLAHSSIAIDGSVVESLSSFQAYTAGAYGNPACSLSTVLSEGYHYATLFGSVGGGGIATWAGSASVATRCSLKGTILG